MTEIVEIAPSDTHDLRRRVLRDGTPSDVVVWEGDDERSTFHLGVRDGSDLVAISTWMHRRYPDLPGDDGFQLRGMATDPAWRGTGVSRSLLEAGLERCRSAGATVVWARARVAAVSFYERSGFEGTGHEYVDLTTGLPHRDIVLRLHG